MEQNNLFRSNGYNIVEMWECEWNKIKHNLNSKKKQIEGQARQQTINIRDALFGGRTEGFKRHVTCKDDQKIFGFDVVSFYPIVNASDDYAVVYGRYVKITLDDILNDRFLVLLQLMLNLLKTYMYMSCLIREIIISFKSNVW
jgi:hypothetical protein